MRYDHTYHPFQEFLTKKNSRSGIVNLKSTFRRDVRKHPARPRDFIMFYFWTSSSYVKFLPALPYLFVIGNNNEWDRELITTKMDLAHGFLLSKITVKCTTFN